MTKHRLPSRPRAHTMVLEPRVLFDGAAAVAATEYQDAQQDHANTRAEQQTAPAVEASAANPPAGAPATLLVIDARVADYQSLLANLPGNLTVRVINAEESGLAAIGAALANGQGFDAVHIVSHGSSGSLGLGNDTLDNSNLASRGAQLQTWAGHLAPTADILLYGCDIAAGAQGGAFITQLATLTGADVAASTDATGAAGKGGNWVLEASTGAIEAQPVMSLAALDGYGALLAATTIADAAAASTRTTTEDTELAISGLSIADADNPASMTLRVQTTHGTARLAALSGASVSIGSNGSADFTLSGSLAQVNSALATLHYTPQLNQNSATAGFAPQMALTATDVSNGGSASLTVSNLAVTQANDAPDLSSGVALVVNEGGNGLFSRLQLASSDNALDPDIATGQQVIAQQMVQITSLPGKGGLTYRNGVVVIGTVVPVSDLANLKYTHNGADITSNDSDSFNVTVSDGGGAATNGSLLITITPVNVAPVISGSPSLIEGQVKVVAPAISLGDAFDTLDNSIIVIDNIVTGGQGTLFIDADGNNGVDAGETLSGSTTLTLAQRSNLATQLKFFQNGAEPNAPGAITPSFQITVTDAGGGTGVPSAAIAQTINLDVLPNNDDPTLSNLHATAGTALNLVEGTKTTILTSGMLQIADADRDPSNLATTTPANQLVYTIGTRPVNGEIQVNVGGGLGPEADGWIVLGDGGRFTQAQVNAGQVRYYQTTNVSDGADTLDDFTFTVRDSAFGYDVWTDPANPTSPREGGLRATPTGSIALQQFHFSITPLPIVTSPRVTSYEGTPRPATSGFGGADMVYDFAPGAMTNGNSGATWNEANVGAAGGYVIAPSMLKYTITRTDTKGTPATGDDVSVTVPENETVYTLTTQAPNGVIQRFVGGSWVNIPTNGQFTQADIAANNIRFVHDGGENHTASFGYKVSDGTPNNFTSVFTINVTPTNDRPAGTSGSAEVLEGNGNVVRLGSAVVGLGDIDLSQDPAKRSGEGAADFLWFNISALAADGSATARGLLQRWDGGAWVAVTTAEWLPGTLLSATPDGGTSGLRYIHDGSEPLAYTGGAKVTFDYLVRDDLADPGNAFATDLTAPPDTSGTIQSNQSATVSATISIIPVNNSPLVANLPGDADPTVPGTITDGGVLTGKNDILANVGEGATVVITSAYLTAVDQDNTTVQRQFRLTAVPTLGVLQLSGQTLGVGSTFTQKNIDDGLLTYKHNGNEIGALINGYGAQYNDKFHFVVNDGVLEDSGAGASDYNTFLITLSPTNDAPTLTAPTGPIDIDSANPLHNMVTGFVVADPDLSDGVTTGETDFVQVSVRLLDSSSAPITDYVTGFAGGGVAIAVATPGDTSGLWQVSGGTNDILQIQGTRQQVNDALIGLSVTFANDTNALYKLQVIVDDRMRNAAGALATGGSDANGGELNQAATVGGTPTAVPGTVYNWATGIAVPASDPNIAAKTVDLRASRVNEVPTFTGPATATVNEDSRSLVSGGFTVSDPESAAFGTPVTVTLSVPSGTLDVGAAGAQGSFTPAGGQAITISGDNTASITLTGRAADIQALLNQRNFANLADDLNGGLFYTSASNINHDVNGGGTLGDVTLTLALVDTGSRIGSDVGAGSVANNPANITTGLDITAINDAPTVNRTATTVAIASTATTAVSGFSITDVDSTDGYVTGETDGIIQATIRLLDNAANPLAAATYATLGITLGSSTPGTAVADATYTGVNGALELRGTLAEINTYLAGLEVTFANLGVSNLDTSYSIEVVADDRLRDGAGALTVGANGGAYNQQANLPLVPTTETFDPYATKVSVYNLYNVTSNTRPLFISSINDPGNITATDVTVAEGSATLIINAGNANISITDQDDNGSTTISATVTVSKGAITAVGGAGGAVGGTGTATISITGASEAQLNSRLQALTITYPDPAGTATAADWNGNFTVTVVYNDAGSTGTRPGVLTGDSDNPLANPGDYAYADGVSNVLVTTRTFTVTVTGVNDAPTRTDGTPVTLLAGNEDVPGGVGNTPPGDTVSNLFGSKFSDELDAVTGGSSAGSLAGIAITTNGAIAAQGSWEYSTDGNTWTALPSVSTATALLLKSSDHLRFVPAANFHGTPGGLTARLVDDSGAAITSGTTADVTSAGGTTRYSDSSNTVTLTTTVTNVNDRPTGSNATLLATTEDLANPPGATVASLGFGYADTTDNQTGITGGANAATALGGIAIVGNAANSGTEGVWQYNTGSGWTTIASPGDASALILPTTASLRFLPNVQDYNGTPGSLSVRVADSTQVFSASSNISGNLTGTDTWSAPLALGTTVNPQNDAPTLTHTATNPTVTENATTGSGTSINPVALLNAGILTDLDLTTTAALSSSTFGSGTITITLTDGVAGDVLQASSLPAGVTSSGGTANTPFVITLDNDTSLTEVQNILTAIQYKNTSDNPTDYGNDLTRAYTVVVSDGNNIQAGGNAGGPSALSAATINGTITITAANDPPLAVNDTHAVTEDTGTLTAGNVITGIGSPNTTVDSDPDNVIGDLSISGIRTGTEGAGGAMTAIAAGTTSANGTLVTGLYGTLTIGANGSYSYVLDNSNPLVNALKTGETLNELFTYTLRDPGNATDIAQLTITINGATDGGVLAITPVDGNAGATGEATVYEKGLGKSADASETTTGTITVRAPEGMSSLTVGGVTYTVAQLTAFTAGSPSGVIDTGEGELRLTGITPTSGPGAAPIEATVSYTYTLKAPINQPAASESSDSIVLGVTDASAGHATAAGTLTVSIVDDVPLAVNDAFGTNKNTPLNSSLTGNDTPSVDVGNIWTKASNPSHGSVTVNTNGTFTYTPTAGYFGPDSFTYTITDSDGDTSTATVTLRVNDLPVAVNDSFTPAEDTPFNGTLVGNDTPSGDGGNVWTKASNPAHGTVTVKPDGSFTYTPTANYHGPDSFTYTVTDVDGDSSTATVTLTVASVNDVPLAVNDSFATREDTPISGVLVDNDTLSGDGGNLWSKASDPAHGTVTVSPDGSFTYTPSANYNGPDSFTYTITDIDGDTSTATVNLTVSSVNNVPLAVDDRFTTNEDSPVNGTLVGNDTPSGDGGNVWSKATNPAHGTVTVNRDGSFTYTPTANYHGPDSFTYTITDVDGDTSTATVTLTIAPLNDVPVAVDDRFTLNEDAPLNDTLVGNDTPSGDGGNVWSKASNPAHGSVTVNPDGSFIYTPTANYHGADSFTYTITDVDGDTSTATVSLVVASVNDVPLAVDDRFTTNENAPLSAVLLGNDKPSGDGGNVWTKASNPAHGTVTVNPDGSFTYLPTANYRGPDSFTYTITDADGDTSTATVNLTLVKVNDPPLAVDDRGQSPDGSTVTVPVLNNDSDPESDPLAVTHVAKTPVAPGDSITIPEGKVILNPDRTLSFAPNPGLQGQVVFSYEISDGNGGVATALVTITVVQAPGVQVLTDVLPSPSQPTLQPTNALIGEQAREPSVFFDGSSFDKVLRLPIPFHPITYVNREVNTAQSLREPSDPLYYSNPGMVVLNDGSGVSPDTLLGFDPNLFVQHEVRDTQIHARFLSNIVDGRLERIALSSDRLIPSPGLLLTESEILAFKKTNEELARINEIKPADPDPRSEAAPDSHVNVTEAEDPLAKKPRLPGRAALSFSEQLQKGSNRLPAPARATKAP